MLGLVPVIAATLLAGSVFGGCGAGADERGYGGYESPADEIPAIDPTPLKKNGQPSNEFEPDDIERAEEADLSVQEYCEGAVSEAQEAGCLSHVEPSEVP